jgi:hypothetical protein
MSFDAIFLLIGTGGVRWPIRANASLSAICIPLASCVAADKLYTADELYIAGELCGRWQAVWQFGV